MQPEITLEFDDGGAKRRVVIHSKRFTIGRSPENDLSIDSSSLSRRHAMIENFEGIAQISDCGSQNGTEVNGRLISAGAVLHDGDVVRLGGDCEVVVQINTGVEQPNLHWPPRSDVVSGVGQSTPFVPPVRQEPRKAASVTDSLFSVPLMAGAGVVLIFLVIGLVVLVPKLGNSPKRREPQAKSSELITDNPPQVVNTDPAITPEPGASRDASAGKSSGESAGAVPTDMVEMAATQVMHRVSSDDKSYSFSEKALRDIQRKVAEYRGNPSLVASLGTLQRTSPALASMARQQGLEPGLLIYAALAETDGGRAGDPGATARTILPEILGLRATFGTNDADSSLILIAAYKMGGGGKKSHPLLPIMRRAVKKPLTQRNIWFLHDSGGIGPDTYDFVIKFLAMGVISQAPRQFGIAADPLSF